MRRIAKVLAAGGLALALALTGCGQQAESPAVDDGGAGAEPTETVVKEATMNDLDGWWKVTQSKDSFYVADTPEVTEALWAFDAEGIDGYCRMFEMSGAFKVDAASQTFQLDTAGVQLEGQIAETSDANHFVLTQTNGTGMRFASAEFTCTYNEDGTLSIQALQEYPETDDDEGALVETLEMVAARSAEYDGQGPEDNVFQYGYDVQHTANITVYRAFSGTDNQWFADENPDRQGRDMHPLPDGLRGMGR